MSERTFLIWQGVLLFLIVLNGWAVHARAKRGMGYQLNLFAALVAYLSFVFNIIARYYL